MIRVLVAVLFVASVAVADEPAVPPKDAAEFMKVLNAIGGADARMKAALMTEGCAEIASCAAGCSKPMSGFANGKPEKLLDCPAFKAFAGNATGADLGARATTWTHERLVDFGARARAAIDAKNMNRYDHLLRQAGLLPEK
jgi:hypothetical protein